MSIAVQLGAPPDEVRSALVNMRQEGLLDVLLIYATAVSQSRSILVRPGVKRLLDRISGLVLIGLGSRLAFENRG